jgi:hypothetical protein
LFGAHGSCKSCQDGELGQSVLFRDVAGVLELGSNLSGNLFDGGDNIDLLVGLNGLSLHAYKVRKQRVARSTVQTWAWLMVFLVARAAAGVGR